MCANRGTVRSAQGTGHHLSRAVLEGTMLVQHNTTGMTSFRLYFQEVRRDSQR